MDIHLRETLCLRNSGRNCHPVEHFKLRYRRAPYDHVFVQRLCGAPSSWTIQKSLPLFIPNRILLCVGISTPPPQLSPKRLWKDDSHQDQGPCCYEKSKKSQQPKTHCNNHSAVTTADQQLPQHLWMPPQLLFQLISLWTCYSSIWAICCPCRGLLHAQKGNSCIFL